MTMVANDENQGPKPPPVRQRTKLGNEFNGTKTLIENSLLLSEITNVIKEVRHDVEKGSVLQATRKLSVLEKATQQSGKNLEKATIQAAPKGIGYAMLYAVKRTKREEALLADQQPKKKSRLSASFHAVKSFVTDQNAQSKQSKQPEITTPYRPPLAREAKVNAPYPAPANRQDYTPEEVVHIKGILSPGSFVKAKKDWVERGLVKCGMSGLFKMLRKVGDGQPIPKRFGKTGRPVLLHSENINAAAKEIAQTKGIAYDEKMCADVLAKHARKKAAESGKVIVGENVMSRNSSNYYRMLLLQQGEQLPTNAVCVQKSASRQTAENSIMSAMATALAIVAAMFIPGIPPPGREIPSTTTDGGQRTVTLVGQVFDGTPGYFARKDYYMNRDDTTVYVFKGTEDGGQHGNKFYLINKGDVQDKGFRSIRQQTDVKSKCGMRVKFSFLFSASGGVGPVVISVLGLSEAELPYDTCPSGIFVLEIPGLAVGSAVDARITSPGYILFLRKTDDASMELKKEQFYFKNVVLPHIDRVRQNCDGYEPGTEVPDYLRAVLAVDGDIPQIKTIVDKEMMDLLAERKIVPVKHSAAESGSRQPADLAPTFRELKALVKTTTADQDTSFRRLIDLAFSTTLKGIVSLKNTHEGALKDLLSCLPNMLQKICNVKSIQEGFIQAGVIDRHSKTVPDLDQALFGTTRCILSQHVHDLCYREAPALLKIMLAKGHIDDAMFRKHGLPIDVGPDGIPVERLAGITGESLQRAKLLGHEFQVGLRDMELERALQAKQDKQDQLALSRIRVQQLNQECEKKLLSRGCSSIEQTTLEHFNDCKVQQLRAFCATREKEQPAGGWPSKGKLLDAQNGEHNLIRKAWSLRNFPALPAAPVHQSQEQGTTSSVTDPAESGVMLSLQYESVTVAPLRLSDSFFAMVEPWITQVQNAFAYLADVSSQSDLVILQSQSGKLAKLLWGRLDRHINTRIREKDSAKVNHWVWYFMRENLHRFAAILVMSGHILSNLDGFLAGKFQSQCLLKTPWVSPFVPLKESGEACQLRGSYIIIDPNRGQWVRSGKATRSFESRIKEHRKGAMLGNEASKFYRTFPSLKCNKDILTGISDQRLGYFEELQFYCGVAFNFEPAVSSIIVDTRESGIFKWSGRVMNAIKKTSWAKNTEEYKRLELVAYGLELAYDLCLAPEHNLSQNPGFETPLGVFSS